LGPEKIAFAILHIFDGGRDIERIEELLGIGGDIDVRSAYFLA
jgi:hypothetical protein